jgi:concanavalin A-like lectin/glucanase superfamily protein
MSAWLFLLTPVAVLVILLLLGLTGCTGDQFVAAPEDTYLDTIKKENSLVAYWRLGEPANTAVPSTGTAIDQLGSHPGNYNKATVSLDAKRHSFSAPGNIALGITPGLLEATKPTDETHNACIDINGGFVEVPFAAELNANAFTFEAWIKPDFAGANAPPGSYYCLVESSAPSGGLQKKLGFGLYVGPLTPGAANQPNQWQVWMGNGTKFIMVATETGDQLHDNQLTFLALTYDPGLLSNNLVLYLYYPNTGQQLTLSALAPLQANFTAFAPNDKAGGGTFLIGIGRNLFPGITDPVALQPFLYAFPGKIQEAAFYSKALSMDVLSQHEMTGGNI